MTVEIESLRDYQLKGNPVIQPVPIVGNLVFDELGQEVLARFNERFKRVKDIEDTTKYEKGQAISYSNTPIALGIDQILRQETKGNIHVLSPYEVVQYWYAIPEKSNTYADTNSIVVYPNEGCNEDLRKRILDIIGRDPKKVKVPIIVSGLGVEKANNEYGFTFTETDYIKDKDAPFLQRDGKVIYDALEGLVSSEDGINVSVADLQSGLRRLCRDRSAGLGAWDDDLLDSDGAGRVQIVQEPQTRAEDLDSLVSQLRAEHERQTSELNSRFEGALRYLKEGKL